MLYYLPGLEHRNLILNGFTGKVLSSNRRAVEWCTSDSRCCLLMNLRETQRLLGVRDQVRSCRWLIIVIVIIISAALGVYLGWRALELNQRARQFLARKGIYAERVSLGLGSIHLQGLKFKTKGSISAFEVKEAAITYSLWGLLRGGASSALRHLSFSEPTLVLKLDRSSGRINRPEVLFHQLPPGRYTFNGGSISLAAIPGQVKLARQVHPVGCLLSNGVKGWIISAPQGRTTLHLEGKLLNDKSNAELDGSFNPQDGTYEFKLTAKKLDLSSELLRELCPQLSFASGEADLSLWLRNGNRVYGRVEVKDAAFKITSAPIWEVRALNLTTRVKPDTAIIEKGEGRCRGVKFQVDGQIVSFSSPSLSLKLGVSHLKIKDIALLLGLEKRPLSTGGGSVSVRIEGPSKDLQLTGLFDQGRILYNGEHLRGLKFRFTKTESTLVVRDISGRVGGGKLQGRLTVGTKGGDPSVEGKFHLIGVDFARVARLLKIEGIAGHGNLKIHLQGNLKSPQWHLWYDSRQLYLGGHNLDGQRGELEFGPQGVRIHSRWKQGEFSASSPQPFKQSVWKINQSLLALGSSEESLEGEINLTGRLSLIEPRGELSLAGSKVDLSGRLSHRPEGSPELRVVLNSNSFPVGNTFTALTLTASANTNQVELRLTATSKDSGQPLLEESFVLRGAFPLRLLHYYGAVIDKAEADINGTVQLSGTLQKPAVAVRLTAQQGRINGLHPLKAEIFLQWDKQGLWIERFDLFHLSEKMLSVKGEWGRGGKLINAEALAIDAASFLSLFSSPGEKLKGKLSYELTFFQHEASPQFNARFLLSQARLMNIPFDNIGGSLRGNLAEIRELNLQLGKKKEYKGTLQGVIPLGAEGEMDVKLKLKGDVLSVLPYLTDQVRESSGGGQLELQLGGRWKTPVIKAIEARFEQGKLTLRSLPEEINRLKGEIHLAKGSNFLEIKSLSGETGGGEFLIENSRRVKLNGRELQPLVIEALGLDLGIIALHTGEAGIKLNIPGLMRPKEQGRFRFSHHKRGEGLYIAGPVQSPQIKGVCYVSDVEFTFPPLKSKRSSSSDSLLEILEAINWDLKVVAGRNVRYFRRQEYSITDIAEAELQIDEGTWLEFKDSVAQGGFHIQGSLQSHQGKLTYLNTEFEVEEIGLELNTQNDPMPLVWGSAKTTVYSDTTGAATDIFLHLYAIDKQTRQRKEKGRWGELRMELTSSDPNDNTPEKILAKLGYSLDNYNQKAAVLLTTGMERILLGSLIRPLEREVKKNFRLDVFYIRPSLVGNLLTSSQLPLENGGRLSYLAFLRGTEWTLGEYFLGNWLFFYTGELKTEKNQYQRETLGMKHRFGIEYRTRATNISFEYNYDDILRRKDKQFSIRRYFSF